MQKIFIYANISDIDKINALQRNSRLRESVRELPVGERQCGSEEELALKQPAEALCGRRRREPAVKTGGYVSIRSECTVFGCESEWYHEALPSSLRRRRLYFLALLRLGQEDTDEASNL